MHEKNGGEDACSSLNMLVNPAGELWRAWACCLLACHTAFCTCA